MFLPGEQILPVTNTVTTDSYEIIFTYDITVNMNEKMMALERRQDTASSEIPMTLWIHCSEENASVYGRKKELPHQKFTTGVFTQNVSI